MRAVRFYIATRLERAAEARALADVLRSWGWVQSYDWTTHGSVQHEGEERIAEVAAAEINGVVGADVVIVLLPGGRGTHCELGMAVVLRKPTFVVADPDDGFFAQDERTCAFYHSLTVRRVEGKMAIPRLLTELQDWEEGERT